MQHCLVAFVLIMCCHGKMNSPNEIQTSKIQNQPHIEFQLCQFCFQYLCQKPVIEFYGTAAQAGCRDHSHGCNKTVVSDKPFAECLERSPVLAKVDIKKQKRETTGYANQYQEISFPRRFPSFKILPILSKLKLIP